tara:strand:+ start:276 stop:1841 length:1566 start_codon:yes stop_codon:yes gene_type:complete
MTTSQTSATLSADACPLLQAIGISKNFGTLAANDEIDLNLFSHEIHALLGENGAGKSTLVKIIYGLLQPSSGEMYWEGQLFSPGSPTQAGALGIGMVFQHFSLFENLSVAENVALGLDGTEGFSQVSEQLAEVSQDYGLPLNPNHEVWRLSVGERQRIEIVRLLLRDPTLLILDEPTAVLTPQEANQLFMVLERLRSEGKSILYISHKLEEVKQLCDNATILRQGRKIGNCDPRLETPASLARMMVGTDIQEAKGVGNRNKTKIRLEVNDLSLDADHPHGTSLQRIKLDVKGGEIFGIAGVAGNGQAELFSALSGERKSAFPQNIVIDGTEVGRLGINARRWLGAAFVPEERHGHGTAPNMKLSENVLLSGHAGAGLSRYGFVDRPATLAALDRTTEIFDVRKSKRDPEAISLSGGNLQKFMVGREILRQPGVLIVSQPTWGVDPAAAAVIKQALLDLAGLGAAILIISQDLDELAEFSDRVAVMYNGQLSEPLGGTTATRERLGLLMGGSTASEKLFSPK